MSFVGRQTELDLLEREVVLALEASAGRSIFVSGPPGAGKTALVTEFLQHLSATHPGVMIGRGRCLQAFGSADPYLPFVDALRDLSDESTPGYVGRDTLAGLVTELAPYWLSVVPMVGGLLSAGFATAARLRGGSAGAPPSREALYVQYLEVVRRLAQQSPLILFLDDLHWADHASMALLAHLSRGIATLPVVVLGTLRSDEPGLDAHPITGLIRELEREELARRLELQELQEESLRALLGSEFAGDVAEPLLHWVMETAGGNPLFATELARLLKQSGAAVEVRGEWQLTDAVRSIEVPRSAEAVIETRIGRLDPDEIRLLQYASVDGNEFNSALLAHLLERDELELLDALERIERRYQLVRTTGELELPDGELATTFAFRHALVQTVLYRQVVGKRRILLHRRCGEILERLFDGVVDEVAGKLARHYHEGRLAEPAFRYACVAAEAARRVYANWEAETMYRLAREHSPDDEARTRIEERLGDVYDVLAYYDRGIEAYRAALERAPTSALRLRRKVVALERKAGLAPAPVLLQRVRELLEQAREEPVERYYLLLETSLLPHAVGVVADVREALAIAEQLDDPALVVEALERLAFALIFCENRVQDALPYLERAGAAVRTMDNPLRRVRHFNLVGIAQAKIGRLDDALRAFRDVLEVSERVGDPRKIGVICNNIGCLLLRVGRFAEAEAILQRARVIHERRDRATLVQSLLNLAERARLTGEHELALERYRNLLVRAREFEYWNSEAVAHAGLGLCLLALQRAEEARRCAWATLAVIADRPEWFEDRDLVEIFLARLEVLDGQGRTALRRLERAAEALESQDVFLWARVELERARVLLDGHRTAACTVVERVATTVAQVQSPLLREQVHALLRQLEADSLDAETVAT